MFRVRESQLLPTEIHSLGQLDRDLKGIQGQISARPSWPHSTRASVLHADPSEYQMRKAPIPVGTEAFLNGCGGQISARPSWPRPFGQTSLCSVCGNRPSWPISELTRARSARASVRTVTPVDLKRKKAPILRPGPLFRIGCIAVN